MIDMYEKLGLFYLGQEVDSASFEPNDALTVLKNKQLTTHAAIIGMTGSGKTGLGMALLEEAAMDNIPALVIDPKGDMGNLCLAFPHLDVDQFQPWVADEARAKGVELATYAQERADLWRDGLEKSHQLLERVARLAAVEKTIYTPGNRAGVSLNILGSLDAPPAAIMTDADGFASYLKTTVSSLLALVGMEANPVESKAYILLVQLLNQAWLKGENVSLEDLIARIISPGFQKIGLLPLNRFFPSDERFALASRFNAILAAPTFQPWLEGEALDIQRLLYDDQGKAKIAIVSIAHLNDEERQFFVAILLNKYLAWMRRQSGTSTLKTLLYMDEIAGFFPPNKNPPSKEPMLLMLKQARAFGIGVVLSTQNPVDLDYKGLSNIGTWFIGRLQTRQDIDRVVDGLSGKLGSRLTKADIRSLLTQLQPRTFFLQSAHLDEVRLFRTRWVMSYLKGPLKRDEITRLMQSKQTGQPDSTEDETANAVKAPTARVDDGYDRYVALDSSIIQYIELDPSGQNRYCPSLIAQVTLHFFNQSKGMDVQQQHVLQLPVTAQDATLDWAQAETMASIDWHHFMTQAPSTATYASVPTWIASDKGLKATSQDLKTWLYQNHKLSLFRTKEAPKLESNPGESLADFKVRLNDLLSEQKEAAIETLQQRYAKKEATLLDRLSRAQAQVDKERSDSSSSMMNAGIALLSALLGKRPSASSIGQVLTRGTKVLKERSDIRRAQDKVENIQDDIQQLADELADQVDALATTFDVNQRDIEPFAIQLKRNHIDVEKIALVWRAV